MRRSMLIAAAVVMVTMAAAATVAEAAATFSHAGSRYYSRTLPDPCFAHPPAGHPHWLAMGCVCPAGEVVARTSTATYRFPIREGTPFVYTVAWRSKKPKISTRQAGPWSYVKVRGPRVCGRNEEVLKVTATPD